MGLRSTLIRLGDQVSEAVVTLNGNRELCAENCRSIVACDENMIILRMREQDIRIVGTGLCVENFGAYGVKVTGIIYSLTLEENGDDGV